MSSIYVEIRKVCEWCDNEFVALKKSTRYCSHACNSRAYKSNVRQITKAKIEKKTDEILKQKPIEDFKDREFLKCTQAAKLIGVSKQTIYNLIYSGKLKAFKLTSRITIIRRKDIDLLLDISIPFEHQNRIEAKPITEFYTISEITLKYGLKTRRIWDIIKDKNIPTTKKGNKAYISQIHIDRYFKKRGKKDIGILDKEINLIDSFKIQPKIKMIDIITRNVSHSSIYY